MKRKKLIATLLFCGASLMASAGDSKINVLYLDGQRHEVLMESVAKLEIDGDDVVLVGNDGVTVATHKINDIDKIELNASTDGISGAAAKDKIKVVSDGYSVTAEGMTDGKMLEMYTSAGKLVGKAVAHNGMATINATSLPSGVYVIKAQGQSLKVVKK